MIFKLHLLQVLRFPGDIEMMSSSLDTGLHHALSIEPVGTDTVEDQLGLPCHGEERGGVVAVTDDGGDCPQ